MCFTKTSVMEAHLLCKRIGVRGAGFLSFDRTQLLSQQFYTHLRQHCPREWDTVNTILPMLEATLSQYGITIDLSYIHGSSLIIRDPNDVDVALKVRQNPLMDANGQWRSYFIWTDIAQGVGKISVIFLLYQARSCVIRNWLK